MTNNGEALIHQNSPRNPSSQPDQDRPGFLELATGEGDSVEHYEDNGDGDLRALANDNNNDGSLANHNDPNAPYNDLNQELLVAEEHIPDVDDNLEVDPGSPGEDEFTPSSLESAGFASQGSGFFAPASPTYSPSLPCLSQSSQDSFTSSGVDAITALENQYVFPELGETELNLSIDCSDPTSQPEVKRRRLDDDSDS